MKFNITEEQILSVAKKNGLQVNKSDKPGFYVNGKEVSLFDVFYSSCGRNECDGFCDDEPLGG